MQTHQNFKAHVSLSNLIEKVGAMGGHAEEYN